MKFNAVLLVVAVLSCFSLHASAQTVSQEFRTAPRSLVTSTVDRTRTAVVKGAVNPLAAKLPDLGPTDPSQLIEHMQFVLARPEERQTAFDAAAEALNTPGTPSFHQWLTPEVIGAEFGPSQSDIVTLTSFLESEGFTVNVTASASMYVDFTGTVAQVENAFHAGIHNFKMQDGSVRFSATAEASIPEALSALVRFISPLGNLASAGSSGPRSSASSAESADKVVGPANESKPLDTESGKYYVGPQDFYTIYNESALITAGTVGTGATIALLEQSDMVAADVTTFRSKFGITPNTPASITVNSHGSGTYACTDPGTVSTAGADPTLGYYPSPEGILSFEAVADIDVEWAGAAAPGAALLEVACASSNYYGPVYAAQYVVNNPTVADILVVSYDVPEAYYSSAEDTVIYNLWEQASAQGQTVVASAGDTGADSTDGFTDVLSGNYAFYTTHVNSLSSTAWNVSVGGTDFLDTYNYDESATTTFGPSTYWSTTNSTAAAYYSSAKSYVPETAWNDTCASYLIANYVGASTPAAYCKANKDAATGLQFTAGGGGPSTDYTTRPSWQNATVYGLPTTGGRLQPDVSLFSGDGYWGHALDYYESDVSTSIKYAGGTGFATAQLAGVFALIKQKTSGRLGQPNYVLYSLAGTEFGTGTTASTITTANTCNGSGTTSTTTGVTTRNPIATCNFYDIQSSDNAVLCRFSDGSCSSGTAGYGALSTSSGGTALAYPTNAGYDMATGIGSINIGNLVANWSTVTLTPTVTVTPAGTATTPATIPYGTATYTLTATVAAPSTGGSYPTGSVTFSATPTVGTIGTASLTATGCTTGATTCSEVATEAFAPTALVSGTVYTVTAAYSTVNENYVTASGTTYIEEIQQTPGLAVSGTNISYGTATSTITVTFTYTGTGTAPTGNPTLTVAGAAETLTCGSFTGSATLYTKTCTYNAGLLAVGSYALAASYAGDTNYTSASASSTVVISKQTPTVTVSNVSIAYGATSATLSLTYTYTGTGTAPSGAVTFVVSGTTYTATCGSASGSSTLYTVTCTATDTGTSTLSAGTYTITGTIAADTNYATASGTGTLTVTGITPTITVSTASTTYGNAATLSMSIAYTGSYAAPTGAASFTVSGTTVAATCTGTSSPLTCTASFQPTTALAVGTYAITGKIAAAGAYTAATTTTTKALGLTITAQTIVITPISQTVTYGTASGSFSYYASYTGNGSVPDQLVIEGSGNPTLTIGSTSATTTYGTCTGPTSSTTSGVTTYTYTCPATYTLTTPIAVGSYTTTVTVPGADDTGNYGATPSGSTTNGYIVTAQTPVITVTAESEPYGTAIPVAFTYTYTGSGTAPTGTVSATVYGNAVTVSCGTKTGSATLYTVACTGTYSGVVPVGTYSSSTSPTGIVASITAGGNFAAATGSNTLTVTATKPVITSVTAETAVYGAVIPVQFTMTFTGAAPTPTATVDGYTVSNLSCGTTSPATCTGSYTGSTGTYVPVGTYTAGIVVNIPASANYTAATQVTASLTITAATPVFTVTAETEPYGTAIPVAFSYTFTGAAPTGTVSATVYGNAVTVTCTGTTSPISCTGTYSGLVPVGTYTSSTSPTGIVASITAAGNYAAASGSATLTVTATTPVITVTAETEPYGTAIPVAFSYTFTGAAPTGAVTATVYGNSVAVTCTGTTSPISCTGTYSGLVPAGTYTSSTSPTGIVASIAAAGNYAAASGSATLTVTQDTITLTVSPNPVTIAYSTSESIPVSFTYSWTNSGAAPNGGRGFTVSGGPATGVTCGSPSTTSPYTVSCSGTYTPSTPIAEGSYPAAIIAGVVNSTNYANAYGTAKLVVTAGTPTLSFSVASPQHTMATLTAAATSNSTGAITYSVVSGPATVSGSTVTFTGAGTVVLNASQAADGNYSAASTNSNSFTVLAGSIWLLDSTDVISTFDELGNAISSSSGYSTSGLGTVEGPLGETFDNAGNAYVVTSAGVSAFSYMAATTNTSPYTSGGISSPQAIAIDGLGHLWVANNNSSVSEITTGGTAISPSAGFTANGGSGLSTNPGAVAVDISGNVWVSNTSDNSVTELLGAGAPVAPLSTGVANSSQGTRP